MPIKEWDGSQTITVTATDNVSIISKIISAIGMCDDGSTYLLVE